MASPVKWGRGRYGFDRVESITGSCMKKTLTCSFQGLLCGMIFAGMLGSIVTFAASKAPETAPTPLVESKGKGAPGLAAAEAISTITGVAISPLLGVSGVGVWHYFKTPSDKRSQLSWYAQPWFWLPALGLVGVCFFKDSLAPIVPTALKKPLDVAEVFENKVSALVATGAILPILGTLYRTTTGDSAFSGSGLAAIDGGSVFGILMVPFAMAAFVVVFLASHVINVLILISPFGTVDLGLKIFRTFLLSTVTATSFANTKVGLVWSLIIIGFCYFLAGWSFRIFVFGSVFSWDVLTGRRHRFSPDPRTSWAFLAREVDGVPIRTYGKLTREREEGLVFTFKPWLVMPERRIQLGEGEWVVGRGVIYPEVLREEGGDLQSIFKLPPRYKSHEEEVAKTCGIQKVDDIGLRAALKWLRELFGLGSRAASSSRSPA